MTQSVDIATIMPYTIFEVIMSTRVAGKLSEQERQQIMKANKIRKMTAELNKQKEEKKNEKTTESIKATES